MTDVTDIRRLSKAAIGGKYYRRTPTGNPKRPWKYYYTKDSYEKRKDVHVSGKDAKAAHEKKKPQAPQRHWVDGADYGLPASTAEAHKTLDGQGYTATRQELHRGIIDSFTKDVSVVPEGKQKMAIMMMGGPASGKGGLVKHAAGDVSDFVNVNPDDVKDQLPEYNHALNLGSRDGKPVSAQNAAAMAHEESSYVAKKVQKQAIAEGKNILVDGTGRDIDSFKGKIKALKDAGYHIRLLMPHIETEDALSRAKTRADRAGRYVPDAYVEMAHHLIPGNFEAIAASVDDFALFDNSGSPPPTPIASGSGGSMTVHNQKSLDSFRTKSAMKHKIAKDRGWMKSWRIAQSMRKAESKELSLSMEDMLKRISTSKVGEVEDNSTGLETMADVAQFLKHLKKGGAIVGDLNKGMMGFSRRYASALKTAKKAEEDMHAKAMMPKETKKVNSENWQAQKDSAVAGYHEESLDGPAGPGEEPGQVGGFKEQPLMRSMGSVHHAAELDRRNMREVSLNTDGDPEYVNLGQSEDPMSLLKAAQTSRVREHSARMDDGEVHSSLDETCPIHGHSDITKSQNLGWDNPFVKCSCG